MSHKLCHACMAWLGPEEFHRDASRPDGLHVWCKWCRRDLRAGFPSEIERRRRETFRAHAWQRFETVRSTALMEPPRRASKVGRRRRGEMRRQQRQLPGV